MPKLDHDIFLVAAVRTPIGKFGGSLGGAVALGHPIGCTGARITTTLLHALQSRDKTLGLATLCISGGMGMAMVVERT